MSEKVLPRLYVKYRDEILPALQEKLGCANSMAVPKLEKVCVNMGVGGATENKKRLEDAVRHLTTVTGQKPAIMRARRSVSAFRLRQGQEIGCRVTLRGLRMYEFLDRLISLALPRIRDFRGLPLKSFDGRGNYTIGLSEQMVFPEIDAGDVEFTQGMDVTLVISGGSDEASCELLWQFGMPIRRPDEAAEGR